MAWEGSFTYVDGTVYGQTNFNAYFRDNFRFLRGIGETETERSLLLATSGLRMTQSSFPIERTYSASPVIYRIMGEKTDGSTAIANGQKVRLKIMLGDGPGGDREPLGFFEAERTGAGSGTLAYYPYNDGDFPLFPAFKIIPGVGVVFGKSSGSHALDVEGSIRALEYLVSGAAIGQWTLDGGNMTVDAEAEVTGQFYAKTTSKSPFITDSRTLVTNLNVPKLRGYARPEALSTTQTTTILGYFTTSNWWETSSPPISTLASVEALRTGWYLIYGQATFEVAGSSKSTRLVMSPFKQSNPQDFIYHTNTTGSRGDGVNSVKGFWRYFYTAGQDIELYAELWNQATADVTASIVALWLSPGTQIGPDSIVVSVTIGEPNLAVT